MSSSKSKKRSGSEMKELVHMDTDIQSEDHDNLPIEIEEEETTQEAPPPTKSEGTQIANSYS